MRRKSETGKTIVFILGGAVFLILMTLNRKSIITTLQLNIGENIVHQKFLTDGNHVHIILMETSGKGTLNLRFMASVESAARYNPKMEVFVFLVTEKKTNLTENMLAVRNHYPNVKYIYTTAEEAFNGTALYQWYKERYNHSMYPVEHLSDALRLIYLQKYGGIYIDLDVIVEKELILPKNAVFHLEYGENMLVTGIMVFQKDHPFLHRVLDALDNRFSPYLYFSIGPLLVASEYNSYKKMNDDIAEYPPGEVAYSSPWWSAKCAFLEMCMEHYMEVINGTSFVHWINSLSPAQINSSLKMGYTSLVQQHAPVTFTAMQKQEIIS